MPKLHKLDNIKSMTGGMNQKRGILVVAGSTASGKTAFAHKFARQFGGEIVNADSRQVYKFLDIGTAKPTQAQQKEVRYHLLDLVAPNEAFTLGQFLDYAAKSIAEIQTRGAIPIVVGGTGQYIHALVNGWNPPQVVPDIALRAQLASLTVGELQARLKSVDPVSAQNIHPHNIRRVIRALEVSYTLQQPFSSFQIPLKARNRFLTICLQIEQMELDQRIRDRIDVMLAQGWVSEIRQLLKFGYTASEPGFSSLGYRPLIEVIKERMPIERAIETIQLQTKQLARRQKQWFKPHRFQIPSTGVDDIDMESLYNELVGCE
jgi:tRNA dimethylallyltransferase